MCIAIGADNVCTDCGKTGEVPINGKCVAFGTASDKCKKVDDKALDETDTTCGKCEGTTFMYKGGCYETSSSSGAKMCKEAASGICTKTADVKNYFVPPGADATHDSVVWCGDAEGVTLGNSKKYTGVNGCTTCNQPEQATDAPKAAICTACGGGKLVKTAKDQTTSCVTEEECANEEGFFVNANSERKCSVCADTCKTCKTDAVGCTSCTGATPYLKKDDGSETGECVNRGNCPATHYVDEEAKTCTTCTSGGVKDCKTCVKSDGGAVCDTCDGEKPLFGLNKKSCVAQCPENSSNQGGTCACKEGFRPDAESTGCQPAGKCATPGCEACDNGGTENEVCTECSSTNYLTPTAQCVRDCAAISGYYGDSADKRCRKCSPECAECVGPANNQCSACPAGRMLQYTDANTPAYGGACVDQCSAGATGEGCEVCGARIGGTDYCSKCTGAGRVSINGVCSENGRREAACSSLQEGVCRACGAGYFLFSGGCYETTRQPGKQVCAQADGGQCRTCANGLGAQDGDCSKSACHPTCATCTAASQADKCSACPAGYYLDAGKACASCTEASGAIQGVANCASCAAPSGN
ncbi:VSP, partial [Giardia lamblia P15]